MAFVHGKNSYFQIGSHVLTSYIDNIDATETADVAETSTMGSTAKSYIVGLMDSVLALSGKWDGTTTVNEVQTLSVTGTVSGGTYTLSFDGQTSASLNWNDGLATIQARLDAFAAGASQIIAAGGTLPGTPVTLTYSGSAFAGSSVPLMTVNSGSLSGGGSYNIVQTTPGTGGPDKVLQALVGAAASTFVYCPAGRGTGVGSGNVKYTGSGILTNYKQTSPIGGVVAWTADFQVTPGSLVRGTL
jgi:hypothetical protein